MKARVVDLGLVPYTETVELQGRVLEKVIEGALPTLLLLEHHPVLTLGAAFHQENLLLTEAEYAAKEIEISKTGRGGDVTYHGPGQLVMYPIFPTGGDLHKWLRQIEEAGIFICELYGLKGERLPVNTGVWIGNRKVAAIGIRVRRWVSMHGIALNCDLDLSPFETIIPCGIEGYGVTSLSQELGRPVTVEETKPIATRAFAETFGFEFETASLVEVLA